MRPDVGSTLELGECLGQGGEARVFALKSNPDMAAKLYHHPTAERSQKLAVMIAHPPAQLTVNGQPVLAWPTERIFARIDTGPVTGFLMPRVAAGVPAVLLYNTKSRLASQPGFNWRYLVRAAMNLSLTFQKVHDSGYVVGDVNDQGVLVTESAVVALVDCDSFQVTDPRTGQVFRSTVGTSLFTPPELMGRSFAAIDRTQNHDLFGLAVIIYQFLMGCHPFQVKLPAGQDMFEIEDCIKRGLYPDVAPAAAQSPASPPLYVLPRTTRALFRAAFGLAGDDRPTAAMWTQELWSIDRSLRLCATNANHYFSSHLTNCPWCDRAASLGGRDAFPSADAIRRGDHLARPATSSRHWVMRPPRPRGVPFGSPQSARTNYVGRLKRS